MVSVLDFFFRTFQRPKVKGKLGGHGIQENLAKLVGGRASMKSAIEAPAGFMLQGSECNLHEFLVMREKLSFYFPF